MNTSSGLVDFSDLHACFVFIGMQTFLRKHVVASRHVAYDVASRHVAYDVASRHVAYDLQCCATNYKTTLNFWDRLMNNKKH